MGPVPANVSAADHHNDKTNTTVTSVDTALLMENILPENIIPENILPGNASLTVPTTSLHLAKLALDPTTNTTGTYRRLIWCNLYVSFAKIPYQCSKYVPYCSFSKCVSSFLHVFLFFLIFRCRAESWRDWETAAWEWEGCVAARRTARTR